MDVQQRVSRGVLVRGLLETKKGPWMIEVVFDIDNNGILSVLIVDMEGGRENKFTVKGVAKGMAEDVDGGGWMWVKKV